MKPQKITLLPLATAQKIAAGEVIDRPQAVVRELLDNAIDAGATTIEVHLEGGGIDKIQVIDNGEGMSKEDLAICWSSHATSKIKEFDDLEKLHTMGFRGEALYSIAACTKLSISSSQENALGNTLEVHSGEFVSLEPSGQGRGTSIVVSDLFYSIPARKKFLKRPSAEATACKKTCVAKLIPFPHIEFKFFVDGKLQLFLPKQELKERVVMAHNLGDPKLFHKVTREGATFSITAILGDPTVSKHDRSKILLYVGNRPIQEYALVQAVQHGYDAFLPGGLFPVAAICIDVDPKLVDVNIHPAKREVRMKNLPEIHHELSHMIKEHLGTGGKGFPSSLKNRKGNPETSPLPFTSFDSEAPIHSMTKTKRDDTTYTENTERLSAEVLQQVPQYHAPPRSITKEEYPKDWLDQVKEIHKEPLEVDPYNFRYLGQLFGVFLIIEQDDNLILVDQHAAHERIIYEELCNDTEIQPLLLPVPIFPDNEEELLIEKQQELYKELGIIVEKQAPGHWDITGLPQVMHKSDSTVVDFITTQQGTIEELRKTLFAKIACSEAIKEGDYLDSQRASAIADKALKLPMPRCPHGRPLWTSIDRDTLYKEVGRLI